MQRTNSQNKSFHVWMRYLAEALNDAGYHLGDGVLVRLPVRYTEGNLKEAIAKPMLNALHPDKTSTTELSTTEIQELYQHLDQVVAERTGVHVEWPCEEQELLYSQVKQFEAANG